MLADTDVGLVLIVVNLEVDVRDLVLLKRSPRLRVGFKLCSPVVNPSAAGVFVRSLDGRGLQSDFVSAISFEGGVVVTHPSRVNGFLGGNRFFGEKPRLRAHSL